jgi:hypothetical protein
VLASQSTLQDLSIAEIKTKVSIDEAIYPHTRTTPSVIETTKYTSFFYLGSTIRIGSPCYKGQDATKNWVRSQVIICNPVLHESSYGL